MRLNTGTKTEQEKRHEVVKLYKRMGGAGARSVSWHRQDLRLIKDNDIAPCDSLYWCKPGWSVGGTLLLLLVIAAIYLLRGRMSCEGLESSG
jgi:hypothetical protein